MNFLSLLGRATRPLLARMNFRGMHSACDSSMTKTLFQGGLLRPSAPQFLQICGFKFKTRIRKRCKDCYFETVNEITYNLCKTHPRHKQIARFKHPKNVWVVTSICNRPKREW